jgi:hypothetical protein
VEVAAALVWRTHFDDPRRSFNVNTLLRPFGLRVNATRADQVTYWVMYVVLLVGSAAGLMQVWVSTRSFAFDMLNGCVDPRAKTSQLGEQAYRPSREYLDCIQGPERTAFLLGAVAVSAVLLAALVVLVMLTQHLLFSDVARFDNTPVPTRKAFNRVYRGLGVCALVLVIITLILVGPRS